MQLWPLIKNDAQIIFISLTKILQRALKYFNKKIKNQGNYFDLFSIYEYEIRRITFINDTLLSISSLKHIFFQNWAQFLTAPCISFVGDMNTK